MTITAQPPSTQHRWEPLPGAGSAAGRGRGRRRGALVSGVLAVALVAGAGGGLVGARVATSNGPATLATVTSQRVVDTVVAAAGTGSLADVVAAVSPSVVSIEVSTGRSTSEGTGIVWSADGLVLTNAHVVAAADTASAWGAGTAPAITVTLSDGTTTPASVIGTDTAADIAVIRLSGVTGLTPATLGTTTGLEVGDTVVAVGSPLGLEGSVTSGIVSALHRSVEIGAGTGPGGSGTTSLSDAIQTDAAVNPGNSGGPLVDSAGRVVGVTTAMATVNGESGSIGIGFAIPVDSARVVAQRLIDAA